MDSRTDPRIDAYVAKAAPFARPLLAQLRSWVHAACPQAQETIKWSMPFFTYRDGILGNMAAFKQHCAFGFWRGGPGSDAGAQAKGNQAMGQFGRIEGPADLPDAGAFRALMQAAMARIDDGGGMPAPRKAAPKPALQTPPDLAAGLALAPAARRSFDALAPGQRREYVEWIVEAKRADTRGRRIAQAVEWLTEGKTRNWKYQNGAC